jgi:DNA-binding response OmpR family regulator
MVAPSKPGWESDNSQFHLRTRACMGARGGAQDRLAVLLVEHDEGVAREFGAALVGQPVEVRRCADPAEALLIVGRTCPDVVVLGPATGRLGAGDFLAVLRSLDPDLPLVVGVGPGSAELAVHAAELGVAAVVPRPYRTRELLTLLRSLARRPDQLNLRPMAIDLGRLRIDGAMPQCQLDGQTISLPPMEFLLLRYFAERIGAVLTRQELTDAVWGDRPSAANKSLTVHIMRLRKRLGDSERDPQWIRTVRGLGYQFTVPTRRDTGTASGQPDSSSA